VEASSSTVRPLTALERICASDSGLRRYRKVAKCPGLCRLKITSCSAVGRVHEKMFRLILMKRTRLSPFSTRSDHLLAGSLSGGQQQMLAISCALMSRPSVVLLDGPSMGLSPLLIDQVFEAITTLRTKGLTVLLVEQNASLALSIADDACVMETGRIVSQRNRK
jgi:ABC-type multidrug transport system ATPase subunit